MPKVAAYALAWSSSQQAYALTEGEGLVSLRIMLDSPAWFAWLAQVPSFAFTGKSGSYTARKETRHGDVCSHSGGGAVQTNCRHDTARRVNTSRVLS